MSYMCSVGKCGYKGSFWKVIAHIVIAHDMKFDMSKIRY